MKVRKRLRGQRSKHSKLPDELDRRLAAFDRWKERIDQLAKEAPEEALREINHGAFQRGRHICAKVIEHHGFENEAGRGAVIYLVSHLGYLLEEVEKVTRAGSPNALAFLWHHATRLCWLLDDVARSEPERLKELAQESLCMPSLRAVPRNFMTDWRKIAEKLQLSRATIVNMCKQAQHELHSATTLFVAHWLERTHDTRGSIESMTKRWQKLQRNPDPEDPWYNERKSKLDEFLLGGGFIKEWELRCRDLPALYNSETWLEWFEKGFKPYVDSGPALSHIHDTRLHKEILKAVGERTGDGKYVAKDYEVRDELKRRCKPKFKSLAPSVEYSQETSQLACRARYRLTDTPYDRIPR